MAFKMKGPSLYQNGAFGKNLNVQKDYAGQADGRATSSPFQQKEGEKQKDKEKPELNQFGETPGQYKKRMEEMGLRKPDKKAPPVKQLVPEPPPQMPQKIQPASPVQQAEPTRRSELRSLRKATRAVKSNQRKTKRTQVRAGRQISRDVDKDLGKDFRKEARANYKADKKSFKAEANKKKQEVKDKWKNK